MSRSERWLLCATILLALGAGVLSLILFWFALLGVGWSVGGVGALWLAIMGGVIVALRRTLLKENGRDISRPYGLTRVEWVGVGIIVAIAAAILFNGAYFPFARDDALGIYRPTALAMWQTGTLEPLTGADSLYRTYPILVPLNYTFAYMVSGWENETLAKSIATLLSLGCLPAVYFLGREMGGRRVGLLAALILALTPSFVRWGSSGYVDLPMAFYYTLGVIFALRFYREQRTGNAALAGVMVGFAAITKNAGLIGVPLLAGWFGFVALKVTRTQRQKPNAKTQRHEGAKIKFNEAFASWRHSVFASIFSLSLTTLIAAPWYIRNLIGAGFLVPDTAWTEQAERTLQNLAIFVTLPDNFLVSGWLVIAGIGLAVWRVIRRGVGGWLLIVWFTLPFFAAWWLFVSYDPRFLLLFYPILCAGAALFVESALRRVSIPRPAQVISAVVVFAIAFYCLWIAVEFKDDILRNPLMSHEEKVALVRDGL